MADDLRAAATILAAIMMVSPAKRLDALAVAIRAALDSGVVTHIRSFTQPSTEETR